MCSSLQSVSKGHREIIYLVYLSCSALFKANYLAALVFLISSGQLEKWKPTSFLFSISLMKVMCIQLRVWQIIVHSSERYCFVTHEISIMSFRGILFSQWRVMKYMSLLFLKLLWHLRYSPKEFLNGIVLLQTTFYTIFLFLEGRFTKI